MSRFRVELACLLVLAFAGMAPVTHGQVTPATDSTATQDAAVMTDEDYAIATVALTDVFREGRPGKLLLIDLTSTGYPPGMAAMTQFGGKAQPLLAQVPKDAADQFDSRNKNHSKIDATQLKTPFPIVTVTPDQSAKLVEGGSRWGAFHKRYPNTPGITLVSLPGVNADHTRALMYIGASCDMLCGNGYFLLLGKDDGGWKVLQKVMIWVS